MKLRSGKEILPILPLNNDKDKDNEDNEEITVTITKFTMTGHGFFGITNKGQNAYIPNQYVPYGHKIDKLGVSYKAYFVRANEIYNTYSLTPKNDTKK